MFVIDSTGTYEREQKSKTQALAALFTTGNPGWKQMYPAITRALILKTPYDFNCASCLRISSAPLYLGSSFSTRSKC